MLADSPVVKRWLELYKPSVVGMTILAVGLILGIVVIALAPATQSAAVVAGNEDSVQRDMDAGAAVAERGADFDFLDHELMVAGGYALAAAAERDAGFSFLDHELKYAGGYALRPAATVGRGADFYFLDHELRSAGGYALAHTAEN
jgi:hypothetical protein